MSLSVAPRLAARDPNRLHPEDRGVHNWYRFVLSFPPHLVREYLDRFDVGPRQRVLDPFCGTGTTLVEARKQGVASVGVERSPMPSFASRTKTNWRPDPDQLEAHAERIAESAYETLLKAGIGDDVDLQRLDGHRDLLALPDEQQSLLLTNSISPLPLHKALVLLGCLDRDRAPPLDAHERLAFARAVVNTSSNLHFGPEVGVGTPKPDAPVVGPWLAAVRTMADDLRTVCGRAEVACEVHAADARDLRQVLPPA